MITTFYPPYNFGGDGIFVHHLSNELARHGHAVEVIHCIDSYRLLARSESPGLFENHPGVIVHGLKSSFGFLSPLASQQTGFPIFKAGLIRKILEKDFGVIHFHNISLLGPKVLGYGQAIKIYTLHEYWLICPTHALYRFNREPCVRPHCLTCTLTYKRPPQWWRYSGLLESALRHVDAFIAPSQISLYKHRQMGLKAPILHLPNFVPPTAAAPAASNDSVGEPSEGPYFLFVGRLEKLKGLQTLIPVFRRYRRAQLLIAGTGSYESQLRQSASGCPRIRFLGHVSSRRLQVLYRGALAVIYPSLNFQGFFELPRGTGAPLVVMEAFSQQTPVIVRNLGRIPDLIMETDSGLVYNTDQELMAEMDRLMADPSYRRQLGLNGYRAFQKNWTAEAHLEGYLDLIRQVATSGRPTFETH